MKLDKALKQLRGRGQAIVKDIAGRRMLVGFERNKRSRKSHVKHFTSPIDLAAISNTQGGNAK